MTLMKVRKKPIIVEAHQWHKNGDHPDDEIRMVPAAGIGYEPFSSEGKVVRYYRNSRSDLCAHCKNSFHNHGWIDTKEGGHIVCPGDWIITGVQGERYPCKPDIFAATYEEVK